MVLMMKILVDESLGLGLVKKPSLHHRFKLSETHTNLFQSKTLLLKTAHWQPALHF